MNVPLSILIPALFSIGTVYGAYPVERPERKSPPATSGRYKILHDQPKQLIEGLGFEIQSDSIGSANQGHPDHNSSVPHDLVPSERERLYNEMLKGFRYCRIAGGLYLRGLDEEQKQLRGRWPTQMQELRELVEKSGVEGVSFEYWSPPPFWKSNRKLTGKDGTWNTLRCFGGQFQDDPVYKGDQERFLKDFSQAVVNDLTHLKESGLPVAMFGLANEPPLDTAYASCKYRSIEDYVATFVPVAQAVRAYDPGIRIIGDTWHGEFIKPVVTNPETRDLVDAIVVHRIGDDSRMVKPLQGFPNRSDGTPFPYFQNEYEYLEGPTSPARCLNTTQNIMNWFQLADSPTWFWIHALKPMQNAEASGYSLGFWKPPGLQREEALKGIKKSEVRKKTGELYDSLKDGHWTWNPYNWHSLAGFLRHMPWNSRCVGVHEEVEQDDNRIFSFKRPDGKLVIVLSNRCTADYTFRVDTGLDGQFSGFRYSPEDAGENFTGVPIGNLKGSKIAPTLPDMTWEFWIQQ